MIDKEAAELAVAALLEARQVALERAARLRADAPDPRGRVRLTLIRQAVSLERNARLLSGVIDTLKAWEARDQTLRRFAHYTLKGEGND